MNFEWIVGGGVLIATALVMKKLQEQVGFQALIVAFTVVWSSLLALHFWGPVAQLVQGLPIEFLAGSRRGVLVAFWGAFLLATLPGILLMNVWLANYVTTFPPLVDALLKLLGTLAVGAAVASLLVLSIAVSASSAEDFDCRQLKVRIDLAPLQAYLWVGERLPELPGRADRRGRLPTEALELFDR